MNWDDEELHPGRILGPYELLVPVGSGGMAHVWAARHRGAGAIFALKMLMPHLAENASFRDMFFDEARIASRIRHENVARTFELVELDGILTLVMEWVDGSSLVHMLRPGSDHLGEHPLVALPVRHAVKMLAETCAGLHAAHDLVGDDGRPLAVVHRDVSPHNILLTLDGHVKVTDFGVAKALGKSHMTIAGQVKGKLAYMSPEQLVGGGIDRRSDVFALGTVLYETTTGIRPFVGEHDPQIMAAIIMGNWRPPRAVVPNYPPELEQIVLRAMATDPDGRYSTALQLRQALEGWLAASGPPIRSQQIALLLQERCGPELTARRNALVEFNVEAAVTGPFLPSIPPPSGPLSGPLSGGPLSGGPLSGGPLSGGPLSGGPLSGGQRIESGTSAMEVDRRPPTAKTSLSTIGGVFAVLLGLTLGLGVLAYVHAERKARSEALLLNRFSDAAVAFQMDGGGAGVGFMANGGDHNTSSPTTAVPPKRPIIVLNMPEDARVVADGVELPAGTTSLRRPDAGMITVLIRADGREDAIYIIEPGSPNAIDVVMLEKPAEKPTPRKPKRESTVVPPNPYD